MKSYRNNQKYIVLTSCCKLVSSSGVAISWRRPGSCWKLSTSRENARQTHSTDFLSCCVNLEYDNDVGIYLDSAVKCTQANVTCFLIFTYSFVSVMDLKKIRLGLHLAWWKETMRSMEHTLSLICNIVSIKVCICNLYLTQQVKNEYSYTYLISNPYLLASSCRESLTRWNSSGVKFWQQLAVIESAARCAFIEKKSRYVRHADTPRWKEISNYYIHHFSSY